MQVVRSKLLGYCHGVSKTIGLAQRCITQAVKNNLPCYSIGNLIHNEDTVKQFEAKGLRVIKAPQDSKPGVALVRAHGIPDSLRKEFEKAGFVLLDSTCANIEKTREQIKKASKKQRPVIVIGKKDHAESICLLGTNDDKGNPIDSVFISSEEDLSKLDSFPLDTAFVIVTQSTFPEENYKIITKQILEKFKNAYTGNKLCQACIIRKSKSLELSNNVDVIVVVGGKNSENTQNLADYIKTNGKPVLCIENVNDIDSEKEAFLRQFSKAGVCSGTSTPMEKIDEVCSYLETLV